MGKTFLNLLIVKIKLKSILNIQNQEDSIYNSFIQN